MSTNSNDVMSLVLEVWRLTPPILLLVFVFPLCDRFLMYPIFVIILDIVWDQRDYKDYDGNDMHNNR